MDASNGEELFSQLRASMGSGSAGGRGGWDARRVGALAVGVVAVALVVVGVSWLRPVETAGAPIGSEVPATSSTATSPAEPASERVWPEGPVEVDGTEVRSGDERWSVGDAGDLVAVGDWDCNGSRTPAVLRPSLGRVFVFDRWAAGDEVTATPGPDAPADAVGFAARGCGTAVVTTAAGITVALETATGR